MEPNWGGWDDYDDDWVDRNKGVISAIEFSMVAIIAFFVALTGAAGYALWLLWKVFH